MNLRVVPPAPHRHCSFCGQDEDVVEGLVAGPQVYICYGCVDMAAGIVRTAREAKAPRAIPGPPATPPTFNWSG